MFNDALTPTQIEQLCENGHELAQVQVGLQHASAGLNLSGPQGTLLKATNIAGPWFAITNTTPSFDVTPTNAAAFFRLLLR